MIRSLLERQQELLNDFFLHVDALSIEKAFHKISECRGTVIVSGVGKSGHVGQKIAATLTSTGTKAYFLDPLHAMHGDLGFVSAGDIALLFSKGGETQELLHLIPHLQRKSIFVIAVVSRRESSLALQSDFAVFLPVAKELCPFDAAPTISSLVQMIFGDCLAIALMQKKGWREQDFAQNHPEGLLGRKMTMHVKDLMLQAPNLPICSPKQLVMDVVHELSQKRCGCLLVCNEQEELEGIFTDGDLRKTIALEGTGALQKPISDVMTKDPLTIPPHYLLVEAARQMEQNPHRLVTVLPVLEGKKLIGLLRIHDVMQMGLGGHTHKFLLTELLHAKSKFH